MIRRPDVTDQDVKIQDLILNRDFSVSVNPGSAQPSIRASIRVKTLDS
jgi:hypothetical protein